MMISVHAISRFIIHFSRRSIPQEAYRCDKSGQTIGAGRYARAGHCSKPSLSQFHIIQRRKYHLQQIIIGLSSCSTLILLYIAPAAAHQIEAWPTALHDIDQANARHHPPQQKVYWWQCHDIIIPISQICEYHTPARLQMPLVRRHEWGILLLQEIRWQGVSIMM